jgi:cytidine deaminase
MCLQTLAEFAGPDLPVLLSGARATVRTTLGQLLPRAFSRRDLARERPVPPRRRRRRV